MGKLLFLCWVIASSIDEEEDLKWLVGGIILGVTCQAVVAIFQGVTGHPLGLSFLGEVTKVSQQNLNLGHVFRAQGTMGHPNTLAMYLSIGVPFSLALLFSRLHRNIKGLVVVSLCLTGSALIFSLSRSAWINFVLTICLILGFAIRRKKITTKVAALIAGGAAVAILGIALYGTALIQSRLTSNDQGSASSRISLARGALGMINDYPLVGVGLNNYSLFSTKYDQINYIAWGHSPPIVHNVYLLVAAETGLIGFAAFMLFLVILLIQAWRIVIMASGDSMWVAAVGNFGALVSIMIHSMVDYLLLGNNQMFVQFWLLAGLSAALTQRIDFRAHAPVLLLTPEDSFRSPEKVIYQK